jgi:adenylylsulfate kinase
MEYKVIWLTGLMSSGKTTIAQALAKKIDAYILDGDELRGSYISRGLGFTESDRKLNLMRAAEIAKMMVKKSHVICAFISPTLPEREEIRKFIGEPYKEIFVDCDVSECIRRDVKGLYAAAKNNEIKNVAGLDVTYYHPIEPEMTVFTEKETVEESVSKIYNKFFDDKETYSLFIGRWNGVFHKGHDEIVKRELHKGNNVLLAIRDTPIDRNNIWSAQEVKNMLEDYFKDNPKVKIIVIPDIASVNYGRSVGYEINEIEVTKETAAISGTNCRILALHRKFDEIGLYVPKRIKKYLEQRYL